MRIKPSYKIKPSDFFNIIVYFDNNNDNRTTVIAEKFNLKVEYVNYIIDFYLVQKRNYMGGKVRIL